MDIRKVMVVVLFFEWVHQLKSSFLFIVEYVLFVIRIFDDYVDVLHGAWNFGMYNNSVIIIPTKVDEILNDHLLKNASQIIFIKLL